ncbi:MAG TPA: ABC transporter permease, partial [Pyrinomonadaceae bacterium]|nr:ABC transporter permease [Pyrinomonadaceae bacterium]
NPRVRGHRLFVTNRRLQGVLLLSKTEKPEPIHGLEPLTWRTAMTTVSQDVRFSLRMLQKHKGFTIVSVLTLALGIGVNTAMFSVLNTFLFGSLPYLQSERLLRVLRTSPHSQSWPFSVANFVDQRAQNTVFEGMAAYTYPGRTLTEQGQIAECLVSLAATADFFPLMGVQPAYGRVFKPEEFEPGVIT